MTRWPTPLLGPLQRLGYAARDGDMIVLDQHGIVEAEPMIAAAADADRIFFDRAQARRCLARADDLRLGVPDRRNHGRRRGGNSAQAAQEIQRNPFRRQNAPRRAGDGGDHVARRQSRAIIAFYTHLDGRIDQLEGEPSQIEARDNAGLARHQKCRGAAVHWHNGVGRQIAGAAEIFEQAPCEPKARS